MKAVFDDESFSFQLLRLLGSTAYGAADIGECLSTAYRITEGDFESWHDEWKKTAGRLKKLAGEMADNGGTISASEAYMRASNYYRTAEFYLHADPKDPRIKELSGISRDCFEKAVESMEPPLEKVKVPYEGTELPGFFYRAKGSNGALATVIVQTGFDGTIEELHGSALAVTARGLNCLTFEGPGQGSVIRDRGLPFRPDWEKVVTPVVDYVLSRDDADPGRLALIGLSFGGYLAPRAAAYEHRLAACVANGGVFDFIGAHIPEGMTREQFVGFMKNDPGDFNKILTKEMEQNTGTRWGVNNGMFTFDASSPADWMLKSSEYTLDGVAEKIECPTLVIDTEGEANFPGEAKKLYDALECPKEFMLFTAEEGAEEHCQIGAYFLSNERIMDWLQTTLE
jgi:pimeloyl-ACP methyl ester carboxylesterase